MRRTPDFEAQNLEKNKNNTVWSFSKVVLLQTTKDKQSRFRNTDIEVVAIFHIYQV